MKRYPLILVAIGFLAAGCEKITPENIQAHNEGNIIFRWGLISYAGPDHVRLLSKDYPCLTDDQIVFYPDRTGRISQGNCHFFQGKEQDINFSWKFTGVSSITLTSRSRDGVEGSNAAYIDGEGEVLTIFESEPVFREYKYRKLPD